MPTVLSAPAVVLDPVAHGLVDPADGSTDLDAMLDIARRAEHDGATTLVVPAPDADEPDAHHRATMAQVLAVLLATETARVVLEVVGARVDPEILARFATNATLLAGDRLGLAVGGDDPAATERVAAALRRRWPGPVTTRSHDSAA